MRSARPGSCSVPCSCAPPSCPSCWVRWRWRRGSAWAEPSCRSWPWASVWRWRSDLAGTRAPRRSGRRRHPLVQGNPLLEPAPERLLLVIRKEVDERERALDEELVARERADRALDDRLVRVIEADLSGAAWGLAITAIGLALSTLAEELAWV